jgi:hypothetical protein
MCGRRRPRAGRCDDYDRPPVPAKTAFRVVPIGVALVLSLAMVGCGHTEAVAQRTLDLSLTEYRLQPQRARVTAGSLTIVVHNFGRRTHNLVVARGGEPVDATKPLFPGDTASLTFSASRGTYLLTSTIQSDQVLGLYGTLVVR